MEIVHAEFFRFALKVCAERRLCGGAGRPTAGHIFTSIEATNQRSERTKPTDTTRRCTRIISRELKFGTVAALADWETNAGAHARHALRSSHLFLHRSTDEGETVGTRLRCSMLLAVAVVMNRGWKCVFSTSEPIQNCTKQNKREV